ncbi:MAG: hypothetical protein N4A53_08095 [Pelagimonas sp.]|jgi:hypothetical protein|nr:hypothetical protein [Pelagimonas sp.]
MFDQVSERLEARVPELAGRVKGALDFVEALSKGTQSIGGVTCYVIPGGLSALQAQNAVGPFTQPIRRNLTLVLMLTSGDQNGVAALKRLNTGLLDDVLQSVMGWAPDDMVGVFSLMGGRVVPDTTGFLAYLIDFQIEDQLRVDP